MFLESEKCPGEANINKGELKSLLSLAEDLKILGLFNQSEKYHQKTAEKEWKLTQESLPESMSATEQSESKNYISEN